MELATLDLCGMGSGGLTMHVNKVDHVKTIDRVAADIGENVDRSYDIAMEMDVEDGVIWVYGSATTRSWRSPTSGSRR